MFFISDRFRLDFRIYIAFSIDYHHMNYKSYWTVNALYKYADNHSRIDRSLHTFYGRVNYSSNWQKYRNYEFKRNLEEDPISLLLKPLLSLIRCFIRFVNSDYLKEESDYEWHSLKETDDHHNVSLGVALNIIISVFLYSFSPKNPQTRRINEY